MNNRKTKPEYDRWVNYIENHPDKTTTGNGRETFACSPYKDGVWVRYSLETDLVIFYLEVKGNGYYHRLDGPAVVDGRFPNNYYICDEYLFKDEFDNHPLVRDYRLNKLISEVLDE